MLTKAILSGNWSYKWLLGTLCYTEVFQFYEVHVGSGSHQTQGGPLQKQQVLLTAKPFLQPTYILQFSEKDSGPK